MKIDKKLIKELKDYLDEFDLSEIRYSVGLGFTWVTALGPLSFAIASVFNDSPEDRTESFQFEIGTQF